MANELVRDRRPESKGVSRCTRYPFRSLCDGPWDDLSGREQPQAPSFMGQLALDWQLNNSVTLGIEWTTMDAYFFSDRHATQSPRRDLINAHTQWQRGPWQLQ